MKTGKELYHFRDATQLAIFLLKKCLAWRVKKRADLKIQKKEERRSFNQASSGKRCNTGLGFYISFLTTQHETIKWVPGFFFFSISLGTADQQSVGSRTEQPPILLLQQRIILLPAVETCGLTTLMQHWCTVNFVVL